MADRKAALPPGIARERWLQAQAWEQAFWDRQNIPPPLWKRLLRPLLVLARLRPPVCPTDHDDRNHWWARQFEDYSMLPRHVGSLCELGCGPYTNTRLIVRGRTIGEIYCCDPLAARYLSYQEAWLSQAHRAHMISVGVHPAEQCPQADESFDVTVLINVLDHVQDPARCLAEAVRITRPGGLVVFGQDLTGPDDQPAANPGHPFALSYGDLEPSLTQLETVYRRIVPREEMHEPGMHCGALAFVGRKLA